MESLHRFLYALSNDCLEDDGLLQRDVPLSSLCSFRIGGPAAVLLTPHSLSLFCRLLTLAEECGVPYRVLGNGSNILPSDNGYFGVLFSTKRIRKTEINGEYIEAECGTSINSLILYAARHNRGGLAPLYGIPASVGGAVYMNAGAHGTDVSACLAKAELFDTVRACRFFLRGSDLRFSYRHSLLQENRKLILLRAFFKFCPICHADVRAEIYEVCRRRRISQPLEFPSAGSAFKRPPEGEAWRFIDACGLRGAKIGGAAVSQKHAGFIVNTGNATAADVRALLALCAERVWEVCGVKLEREIEFL